MHWFIYCAFRLIRFLDVLRRTKPWCWNTVVTILFGIATTAFRRYVHFTPETLALVGLENWRPLSEVHWLLGLVALGLFSAVSSLLFSALIFPVFGYLPFTLANKHLGIVATSMDARLVVSWMKEAARRTIAGNTDRIKVVCLTGKHLWQAPPFDGVAAPLVGAASAGKLDVIMPRADPKQPTVQARFATYTSAFKSEQGINSEDDLVQEMVKSRADLLRRSPANTITEHGILCMWRIVLTEEFCIVQSYFPNHGGADSFKAPAFFYKNVNVGRAPGAVPVDCLYDTYAHMVELVSRSVA